MESFCGGHTHTDQPRSLRHGKKVAYQESNQQPTVSLCYHTQNPSYHYESSSLRCVRFHAARRTSQTHHSRGTPVLPLPLPAPSFHYRVLSLTPPALLCSAPSGGGLSFTVFSSSASRTLTCTRRQAGRQSGDVNIENNRVLQATRSPFPSHLPQNTPLLVGKHTFTQIFLPIWSSTDGALRQRRV